MFRRIMLREGVLSPHSKLLAADRGLNFGSGLFGGRESVASQLSSSAYKFSFKFEDTGVIRTNVDFVFGFGSYDGV